MDVCSDKKSKSEYESKTKKSESKCILKNIKSIYILKKIFNNIQISKKLGIIQYNKTMQKRLGICINDYSQFYSIEIEIKLTIDKYGNFINRDNTEYYHIYFDDKSEEINRDYLLEGEKVNKIKIIIDHQVTSFRALFNGCTSIESINFKKFNRIDITDMEGMFCGCSSLICLNLSNFKTKNVTNMKNMFYECSSLKDLNLSNFNTNNVKDMSGMFFGCSSLI